MGDLEIEEGARSMAVAFAAAIMLTMTVPTGNAFAIDHVECRGKENFPEDLVGHSGGRDSVDCYANRGRTDFGGWWGDRISTGNNDLDTANFRACVGICAT